MKTVFLHAFPLDQRMWDGYEGAKPRLYGLGASIDGWEQDDPRRNRERNATLNNVWVMKKQQ